MPKIFVLDELSEDGLDLLEAAGNLEVKIRTGLKGADCARPCSTPTAPSAAAA